MKHTLLIAIATLFCSAQLAAQNNDAEDKSLQISKQVTDNHSLNQQVNGPDLSKQNLPKTSATQTNVNHTTGSKVDMTLYPAQKPSENKKTQKVNQSKTQPSSSSKVMLDANGRPVNATKQTTAPK